MPSNKQRRDAERLRLQRQLEQRREREIARRRTMLIVSIAGALVLIGGVIAIIAVFAGGPGKTHHPQALSTINPSPTGKLPTPKNPPTTSATPVVAAPKACAKPAKTSTVQFDHVTVKHATDVKHPPMVTAKSATTPKALECRDLVVGKGTAATPNSTVTIQYTGVLYKDGKVFDSSWSRGQPASFPLNRVVPGFRAAIGGAGKLAPMRVGGRRILILPPALGYGSQAQRGIPANSTLVFVVDLLKVSG